MTISALCVDGYRSIKHVHLPLEGVNVLVGPNGSGKTNLYRAMFLIHQAAHGRLAQSLAEEGGMASVMWAGPRREGPVRLELSVRLDQFSYHLECGLPSHTMTMFHLDPEIKEERIYWHEGRKAPRNHRNKTHRNKTQLLGRKNGMVWARDGEGSRVDYPLMVSSSESVLAEIREPHRFPELSMLRQEFLKWRFYHHFRTDVESPLRQPQIGVRTPVLSHDGRDLAAAIQTILEIGRGDLFMQAVQAAFPGSALRIEGEPRMSVAMEMPGVRRPFGPLELSDGTLQYLCLLAALLSPRPPTLLALNEPETSIHPDLLRPLARMIIAASAESQLWVTTHSTVLADAICADSGVPAVQLEKVEGETRVQGQSELERRMMI